VTYDEIKRILLLIDSPIEKLEMVMELGQDLQEVPQDAVCTEIAGCSSLVEICKKNNRFWARADSGLVRGIVAILVAMVDGKTPDEIKKIDMESEFQSLNLNLGAGRLNGVNSMIRFFKNL